MVTGASARAGSTMELSRIIHRLDGARIAGGGDASTEVTGVAIDSRTVRPGDVFVAVRGTNVDGHAFIGEAISRGAAAVVAEKTVSSSSVPTVVVDDTARALAIIAAAFFGYPADQLVMCGVTGTNGKTSVAHLVRAMVGESKLGRLGIVGTLGHGINELTSTPHTTPDAVTLHRLFRQMVDDNCFGVVMEVSSHAVRQHRTWGLDFEVGILTNVTHDHLDFHKTMEDYRAAKREFCDSLVAATRRKPKGTLVYWADDPVARDIGGSFAGRSVAVGAGEGADVRVVAVEASLAGTRLEIRLQNGSEIEAVTRLLGTFVAANASLAAAAAVELGAKPDDVTRGLSAVAHIPGRFDALGGAGKPVVVIDYSHTPDAVERVLATCRALGAKKLFAVFGCGGDRDRSKRPLIGKAVQRQSDACIITTDNPRNEPVEAIIADILDGMDRDAGDYTVELDRAAAIAQAIAAAGAGDVVALLGKGHEGYQIIGDERHPFSDRAEAERALAAWRAA